MDHKQIAWNSFFTLPSGGFSPHKFSTGTVAERTNFGTSVCFRRLIPGSHEHVVFTTPYVVVHPDHPDWMAYFRRTLAPTAPMDDYERHMKYGPRESAPLRDF